MNKLLTSLINFGKEFNTLTSVSRLAIIGGVIFIISFMLGKSDGNSKQEQFNVKYAEFKNNSEKVSNYADSLKVVVEKLQEESIKKMTLLRN